MSLNEDKRKNVENDLLSYMTTTAGDSAGARHCCTLDQYQCSQFYISRVARPHEDTRTGLNQVFRLNKVLRTGPNQVLRSKMDLETHLNFGKII